MAGNVWEWVADWYDDAKTFRVLRGGSWDFDPTTLRAALRNWNPPGLRLDDIGFRCARDVFP
jgi:formylglycine-generating enzyme required for sulfatase activity